MRSAEGHLPCSSPDTQELTRWEVTLGLRTRCGAKPHACLSQDDKAASTHSPPVLHRATTEQDDCALGPLSTGQGQRRRGVAAGGKLLRTPSAEKMSPWCLKAIRKEAL